jgi:hypothetical protein
MNEQDGYGSVSFGDSVPPAELPEAAATTAIMAPVAADPVPADPVPAESALPAHTVPADAAAESDPTLPLATAGAGDEFEGELVTCPECGTAARVVFKRRDARDFCRACDYPLFWTPSAIQRDRADADESLRRLPGTMGRATIASLPCPHCAELNALSAQICVRCGLALHPEPAPPPPAPAPVYVAPPPAPEPEPERGWPWWAWLLLAIGVAAAVTVAILYGTGVLG